MSKRPAKVTEPASDWRANFQSAAMRTSFTLSLTHPMIEFLCAVADGVHWDRTLYVGGRLANPDSFLASAGALMKRGLIERVRHTRPLESIKTHAEYCETHPNHRLTPAGEALVELLKVTGIFVVADSALAKAARKGA